MYNKKVPAGMKAFFWHYRYPAGVRIEMSEDGKRPVTEPTRYFRSADSSSKFVPSERGGKTVCILVDEETDSDVAVGEAFCRHDEQFRYKLGCTIALGRAVDQLDS